MASRVASADTDLAYSRAGDNVERLAATLRDIGASLDETSLAGSEYLTFATDFGKVDVLASPAGAPAYETLRAEAMEIGVEGRGVRIASLDRLIAVAEAMGRTKDKLVAGEYRVISDLLRAPMDDEKG